MTIKDEWEVRVQAVHTKEDLAKFIRSLATDFSEHGEDWTNRSVPEFLEAASGWVEDLSGYYKNQNMDEPTTPSWQTLARILLAARIYE